MSNEREALKIVSALADSNPIFMVQFQGGQHLKCALCDAPGWTAPITHHPGCPWIAAVALIDSLPTSWTQVEQERST